ncbi:MAG: deoxyribose-phosphate aldolase [Actinomycetota bacterium]|nr:deoxyribose-phosphate aldolase [Candidatus Dormibacteraeota bacterium]MDQ6916143.1 deoxyribose-phosphate aldolase [Actinomycetota bacterium]
MSERSGAELLAHLTHVRREHPERIADVLHFRRRRPLLSDAGTMFLVAADHPARGILRVGADERAMADRGEMLRRLLIALSRPGVDGVMATPDVVEDLALLGALEERVVFGSMNRGGLAGSAYELDDAATAYSARAVEASNLDGGKLMVRVADDDPASLRTMVAAAEAISQLAVRRLTAMVEVFASTGAGGHAANLGGIDDLVRAVHIVQGLGETSAYTWLKLPVAEDLGRLLSATSLPVVLLGGDPGPEAGATYALWAQAMARPQVVGLVAGRTLLYPDHGDVGKAVDEAAAIVARGSR